ncbi:hypothetical protein [Providencia huaxiensis]|uniref:hypothetical protein n=1 Tax=Providencia huaxiensis TaxID=2027290 RepID=UPI003F7F1666
MKAAMANAGQNWFGYVHVLPESAAETDFVDAVMKAHPLPVSRAMSISVIPIVNHYTRQTLRANLMAKFGRWTWAILRRRVTKQKKNVAIRH